MYLGEKQSRLLWYLRGAGKSVPGRCRCLSCTDCGSTSASGGFDMSGCSSAKFKASGLWWAVEVVQPQRKLHAPLAWQRGFCSVGGEAACGACLGKLPSECTFLLLNHSWGSHPWVYSVVWCLALYPMSQPLWRQNHQQNTQSAYLLLSLMWRCMGKDPSKMKISRVTKLVRAELPKLGPWSPG